MTRNDFIFKEGNLKIMPLDKEEKYSYQNWMGINKNKENWEEVIINSIELEECIGYGANGIVFKALEKITNRTCAVKIWLPNRAGKNYNVYFDKYADEVQKLAGLSDESIVSVYSADKTDNGYYYSIMEWVTGVTLNEMLNEGTNLRMDQRFKILDGILSTIKKCHEINVFHGDLHAKNILLEREKYTNKVQRVKLLDFGTSLFNRSIRPKYSQQRESALLLETTLKLLPEEDKYNFLNFRFYSVSNKVAINKNDDVRNFHPLYVSTTLNNLIGIYSLLEDNFVNFEVISDLLELAFAAPGVNINLVLTKIAEIIESDRNNYPKAMEKMYIELVASKFEEFLYVDSDIEIKLLPCYFELIVDRGYERFDNQSYIYSNRKEILQLENLEEFREFIFRVKEDIGYSDYLYFLDQISTDLHELYWKGVSDPTEIFIQQLELRDKRNFLRCGSDTYSSIIKSSFEI